MYNIALRELQELESEPLCHRIAARLLVNNCHLLDGQDEATVHIDSGRATRDFVDSYAASLAICDLERGSFSIPPSCSKFREAALAVLPVPVQPQLHVSTPEIDDCLEGLARSDSAWNTWVSYRHKALRFCEAARADNEKAHNIHLYQRVTKILETLTTQIETELEERLQSLNRVIHSTTDSVDTFATQVDQLKNGLDTMGKIIQDQLHRTAQESSEIVKGGLEDARSLQQIMAVLLRATMDATAEVAASHSNALQAVTHNANNEVGVLMNALNAAMESSVSLQIQMEATHIQTGEIMQKQSKIEEGMERLEGLADELLVKFDSHEGRLEQAQKKTGEILDTLEAATESAENFRSSIYSGFGLSGLWPHVLFPVASLVMGSYGLEPSIGRNLWLVGLGEVIGLLVSSAGHYADILLSTSWGPLLRQTNLNATSNPSSLTNDLNTTNENIIQPAIYSNY
ncbi:hypothetical protein AK830_g3973 [Neonectria ditissima]|uniref:Nuclear membrane fusion protein Kar5 n=1 Tax=Neonectria ditissima TaxID=78410 RepID=A0A0P7BNY5_9HYPO|nr:hypothetical protein AK830_g3973 [Neonectria ditissima]